MNTQKPRKIGEILAEWSRYLELSKSPGTAAAYSQMVGPWLRKLGASKLIESVTFEAMQAFVNDPSLRRPARCSRLAALRHLWRYAHRMGWVQHFQADAVFIDHRSMSLEQLEARVRLPFTEDEYAAIAANTEGFWHYAAALGWWAGLRLGDICTLERSSVGQDEIIVWTRKRGKRVALPLDDPLIGSGELRLVIRQMRVGTDAVYFFPEKRVRYIAGWDGSLSNEFAKILREIGLKSCGKSFHSLRHSAVTRWKTAGKSLEEIGRLVAHSSQKTTQGYIHA